MKKFTIRLFPHKNARSFMDHFYSWSLINYYVWGLILWYMWPPLQIRSVLMNSECSQKVSINGLSAQPKPHKRRDPPCSHESPNCVTCSAARQRNRSQFFHGKISRQKFRSVTGSHWGKASCNTLTFLEDNSSAQFTAARKLCNYFMSLFCWVCLDKRVAFVAL